MTGAMDTVIANRISPRLRCSVDALACTTIIAREARIIDLSPGGARVQIAEPFPRGTRIHLDVDADFYWGTVMWDEVDRMGLRFHTPIRSGALHRILQELQAPPPPLRRAITFGRRGTTGSP